MAAEKNGFVYIYISNESNNLVYFDNLLIIDDKGPILEESHYYPYGLKMAGISSSLLPMAGGSTRFGFQGSFAESVGDLGINENEFDLRHYNPQIGRWTGSDPYDEFASPYVGMGNNPVNTVDPDGGDTFDLNDIAPSFLNQGLRAVEGFLAGAVIGAVTSHGQNWLNGGLIGAGATLIGTNVNWGKVGGALDDAGKWIEDLTFNRTADLYILNNTAQAFHMGNRNEATAVKSKSGFEYVSVTGADAKDGTADFIHLKPLSIAVDPDELNKEFHMDNLAEGMDWLKKHYNRMVSTKITKAQGRKVIKGMIDFAKSGPYKTLTRNCADAVLQGLKLAKIYNGIPGIAIPNVIYLKLRFYLPIYKTELGF